MPKALHGVNILSYVASPFKLLRAFRPVCEEYDDLFCRISEDTRYWRNTLSDADFSRLEARDDLYITSMGFEVQAAFRHGFALGTYALLESLDAAKHLLSLEP